MGMNTNPTKGPIHYRAPGRILWRAIRGMIPHKTARGAAAMERLKSFEGVPPPFDKLKRVVVPEALKVIRLKPGRNNCRLGDLATQVGWRHDALVQKLETKRKASSSAFYRKKKAVAKLTKKAEETVKATPAIKALNPLLSQYGF